MKKIFIILSVIFTTLNISCKKEVEVVQEALSEYAYLAKFNELRHTKVNGGFLRVQNHRANFGASPSDLNTGVTTETSETFFDKIDVISLNNYEIDISDLSTQEVFKEDKSNFFGKEITLSFKGSIERNDETFGPYYVPEIISVDIPTENEQKVLRDGSVITWNADPLNEEGVLILVDYMAKENSIETSERQIEIEVVPDNGSYTFSKSDFPLIPEESLVLLRVVRGIYDFIDLNNFSGEYENDFLFMTATETAGYTSLK